MKKIKEEQISADIIKTDKGINYSIVIDTVEKEFCDEIRLLKNDKIDSIAKDPVIFECFQKINDRYNEINEKLPENDKYNEWRAVFVRLDENLLEVLESMLYFIVRNALLKFESSEKTFDWIAGILKYIEFNVEMHNPGMILTVVLQEMARRKRKIEAGISEKEHISFDEVKLLLQNEIDEKWKEKETNEYE